MNRPPASPVPTAWGQGLLCLCVAAIAILYRSQGFGDVIAHADEQFYLLVGDRILNHGAVPYIDIWDRKPVGLFLVFAAIRLMGGDGIVQYQAVAAVAAAASAVMITLWIRRFSGPLAAAGGGLLYVLFLEKYYGFGGQAEVFMNLLVIGSGFLVHGLVLDSGDALLEDPGPRRRLGLAALGGGAMLLAGLAIQIKPTALFPCAWLGLALIYAGKKMSMKPIPLGLLAAAWAGVAALPTLAAAAWYIQHGQWDAFWFANVLSNGLKGPEYQDGVALRTSRLALTFGAPVMLALILTTYRAFREKLPRLALSTGFLCGWLVMAFVGFLYVKAAYAYYALIMAPMAAILLGYAFGSKRWGWTAVAVIAVLAGQIILNDHQRLVQNRRSGAQLIAMAKLITPALGPGCLYVYHGPVVLYGLTHSCLPTRFAFPNHLSTQPEAPALGVDASQEVARILAAKPPVIVIGAQGFHPPNLQTDAMVKAVLAQDYVKMYELPSANGDSIAAAYKLKPPPSPDLRRRAGL